MTLARGFGAIFKNVTQMAAASSAMNLGSGGEKRIILLRTNGSLNAIVKTWPASFAIVFGFGRVQRQIASFANIGTRSVLFIQWA
tara:strand:- start:1406 stop:1660 length:255 start_codon:yes stop_codon:yes gene_type:complete